MPDGIAIFAGGILSLITMATLILGPMMYLPLYLIEGTTKPALGYVLAFFYLTFRTLAIAATFLVITVVVFVEGPADLFKSEFFSNDFGEVLWLVVKIPAFFSIVALVAYRLRNNLPEEGEV
ncbi:hypothetical protein FEE96_01095 [Parasedimentitalea maritima]|uniref:Uncharacterized protein n=1 Tax=Parasedimentitalea maritima TaxID=2578117 RepID=A0ABY2UZL6_9RHOB|nr:hypothetical protein [Zongyanglinia marina]TLP68914.1 hypothetical protein FEE96_01095 [Zongyanglinia marina]